MLVTKENLEALGVPASKIVLYLDSLNASLVKYEINTPIRITHFLAQILHESAYFKYSSEIASGAAYEGRKDLGNIIKGDGVKFKGRGLIQLTGRDIYKSYGKFVGLDFTLNPELVATPNFAIDSACWFWTKYKKDIKGVSLKGMSDSDDFLRITYFVNGGFNGVKDRYNILRKSYKIFGIIGIAERLKVVEDKIRLAIISTEKTNMQKSILRAIPSEDSLKKFLI